MAETDSDIRVWRNKVQAQGDLLVLGRIARTVEVPLGAWLFSAPGQGSFTDGLTLTTPHVLCLKLLTGTGTKPTAITVHGTNQEEDPATLTGVIPGTRGAGTYITLTPANSGDEFTNVTSIVVTQDSGLPGEAFQVVNIPEESA